MDQEFLSSILHYKNLWKIEILTIKLARINKKLEGCRKPAKPDPTQPVKLGWFLGLGGLGWVRLGLGHKITNPSNLTWHDPPIF